MQADIDIIVFGSIAQDLISFTENLPRAGETVPGISFEITPGGKGSNQAVQAKRLGANVVMVGKVGADSYGECCINSLKNDGIITDFIERSTTSCTATAAITVAKNGENTVVINLGANLEITASRASQLCQLITLSKILMCQNEINGEASKAALEIAKSNGVTTFFNFAPHMHQFDKSVLKYVDIICVNRIEAEQLSGKTAQSIGEALTTSQALLKFGPCTVVTTLGSDGVVFVSQGNEKGHIPAFKVDVVDTTGAGDSFCGALAYFFAKAPKLKLYEKVRRASLIASISVQFKGTQKSLPSITQIPKGILQISCND